MRRAIQTVIAAVTALLVTAPVFAQAPTPRDGRAAREQRLTPEQRRAARQGLGPRAPRGRRALKQLDTDGNGTISRQEWNRRPEAFDRLDANKDGQITSDELRGARHRAARRIR
jgi:hypothetical protein